APAAAGRAASRPPSTPDSPTASSPAARNAATTRRLAGRASTISTTSATAGGVTRVPSRFSTGRPRAPRLAPAAHHHHRLDALQRARARREPVRARERAPAEFHDPHVQHGSPAVSASPAIRFMFWIAWPAAPFMRLSIAATTVSRGRRTCATAVTPIATRLRYTTSRSDGGVPRTTCTHGSAAYAAAYTASAAA